jgi:hypothetical protein
VSAATNETETGLVLGTPQHMSSERRATVRWTARCVLTGVVMYEMLVGRAPGTRRALVVGDANGAAIAVCASRSEIPEASTRP